jgi:hypothetical protein
MPPVRPPEVRVLKQQVATHRKNGAQHQQTDVVLKIALVGPCKSGKTRLSNQLAAVPILSSDLSSLPFPYQQTAGVRILSFPCSISASRLPPASGPAVDVAVSVELWDVSGSSEHESCWPAVCASLDGLILVFDPQQPQQLSDLKAFADVFLSKAALKQGQVQAWALTNSGAEGAAQQPAAAVPKQLKVQVKAEAAAAEAAGGAAAGDRTVIIPVISVSLAADEQPAQSPTRQQFDTWLGASVYALHPKAEFETEAK